MAITTTITVQEIHCESCERAVRSALSRLPGVLQVSPSAERNEVQVSYDENQVDKARLRAKLAEIGYDPLP